MSDLNRIRPALRTKGAVTGNFGKSKVRAGSTLNDIGHTDAEVVKLATIDSYFTRLEEALTKTTDPELLTFLNAELKKIRLQSGKGLKRIDHSGRTAQPYRTPGT